MQVRCDAEAPVRFSQDDLLTSGSAMTRTHALSLSLSLCLSLSLSVSLSLRGSVFFVSFLPTVIQIENNFQETLILFKIYVIFNI